MKKNTSNNRLRQMSIVALSLSACELGLLTACANPTGGTVAQGAASFNSAGSTFTINSTSANTLINWQSFNIANGESTIFNEPSSSSVVWNQINDSNPSQILGSLSANGLVVLQNQHGFYVGGSATISAHGLVMTTSPTPAPNLSSGGAWEFDTPPPTIPIINYGKINISGAGSAYLIADDIQNYGTISAEQGKIGLYAGKQVLLSTSPDGRGINAQVTLPAGSVDNEGNLIADGGTIAALAQTVNQNGLAQANSVKNVNGVIELVAGGKLTVGANSDIEANGDSTAGTASPGGFAVLQSGNIYSDTATSKLNVSGQNGGQNGIAEIFGNNLASASSLNSIIGNTFALLVNPYDITLSGNATGVSSTSPTFDFNFNVADLANYAQIDLHAQDNVELSSQWSLSDPSVSNPGAWGALSLQAGNSIVFDPFIASLVAGKNWDINLIAGTAFSPTAAQPTPPSGSYGVYLNDNAYIQTQNGDINVWAANEVQIATDAQASTDGIRTSGGGNISVATQYGDVNTGGNTAGFDFNFRTAPYYTVDANVGGISTAAGGNVTINAGGNVVSYNPVGIASAGLTLGDAGTGAFGPQAGNVTITAGGNIYGHYVLANGTGTITANGGNVGAPNGVSFALSLIDGSWNVNAPNGNIYLQEVRNPNGVFNSLSNPGSRRPPVPPSLAGQYLFNYGAQASVNLDAGNGVYLTDSQLPRLGAASDIPALYPPVLSITAGPGGVTLEGNITLFPSADQNLSINTSGNLVSSTPGTELLMSDSAQTRWVEGSSYFNNQDHGPLSAEPTDPTPVTINVSGNMENLALMTTKETKINVGGDMIDCSFSGQNLHSSDITSINVGGQIYNQSAYTYVDGVNIPGIPASDLPAGVGSVWDTVFLLAMDPTKLSALTVPGNLTSDQYLAYAVQEASLFGAAYSNGRLVGSGDQGFLYTPDTGRLWYGGSMPATLSPTQLSALMGSITILHLVNGVPQLDSSGHFVTDTYNWVSPAQIAALSTASQNDPSPLPVQPGYHIGGPGQFDITASSISLGDTYGILSCGSFDPLGAVAAEYYRYNNLASITPSSADINIELTAPDQTATENIQLPDGTTLSITPHASLDLLTSTIASLGGGNVTVKSDIGSLDLGSSQVFNTGPYIGLGIYSAAGGNVTVKAQGNVNLDGSRIATYDGGDIFVESYAGNVDVGSGTAGQNGVFLTYNKNGVAGYYQEYTAGSGIVAYTLAPTATAVLSGGTYVGFPPAGSSINIAKVPGNITVLTPAGNITATLGGITQIALDGTTTGGPTVDLEAGTPANGSTPAIIGNIDLGNSGVIGGSITLKASGSINANLIVSRQNSNVQAAQNFNGTVLAGGNADVSGGGTVAGTIVGVGGANVSGGSVSATVLSQNASVNGAASSTLGTSASATSASQSAAQQANSEAKQEVASNDNSNDDDKKKKKGGLIRRVKRVTVILPQKA